MTLRARVILAVLWGLSLVGTAAWTTVQAHQQKAPPGRTPGVIITGDDLGFRVEGRRGAVPTGTLMVRIDGEWMEARFALRVQPIK